MLLHAFQEQVIVSQGSFPSNQTDLGLITSKMSAIVDLRQVEPLFLKQLFVLTGDLLALFSCNANLC